MIYYEFERRAFDGISLYFQGWQTEQAQKGVVCLLHGLGEHSGRYSQWANWLNKAGYSVLTIDLRGHGKSEGQRGHVSSYNEYFEDTDLLLKEAENRFPRSPLFLYGHSLGAMIIAHYVLIRKPKLAGVILTALANKSSIAEQKLKVILAKVLGSVGPKISISTGLVPSTLSRDPEVVSRYINDPLVHHLTSLGWGKATLESIAFADQHAHEWTYPVLIMHGELDKLGYSEGSLEFASKIKGDCTIKIWTGLFHEIHNEPEKGEVFEYLRQWLDQHAST